MPDDKSIVGGSDRGRVAAEQPYEVRALAEKHRISIEQAKSLIERHGKDREALDEAARPLHA